MKSRIFSCCLALVAVSCLLSACRQPVPPPQRVVLVTIDTLRADHLGSYGYPRNVSPFLDRLAAEGVLFTNNYATSSTTVTCHASLFTSLYPAQHRLIRNGEVLHDSVFTMAEMFRDQGYETGAFTTVGFISSLDRGFGTFDSEKKYFSSHHVVDKTIGWLEERAPTDKIFLWVHLFDVHEWYKRDHLDPEFRGKAAATTDLTRAEFVEYLETQQGIEREHLGGEDAMLDVIDRYDDQIMSTDGQLERLFDFMAGAGLDDDTLWILSSDHGEGLGSHKFRGHGAKIYNEQVRVPLIFHFSDRRHAGKVVDQLVRHVDILPTLAEMIGAPLDEQVFPIVGDSLLPLLDGEKTEAGVRYSYSQRRDADDKRLQGGWEPGEVYSIQTLDYKYIFKSDAPDEFYDLSQDPLESVNLAEEPSDIKDRMRAYLAELYKQMMQQGEQLGRSEIRPEHIEELKALGYL